MTVPAMLGLLIAGVGILLLLVIVVRLPAFVALLVASLIVAVIGGIPLVEIAGVIQEGMAGTLGYIAIVIGVGAIFGEYLQRSGGAERIATHTLERFGETRAPWALGVTGIVVAIPVFFDVALILFLPLIYTIAQRTGRSLLYYAIPLLAGIAVAHAFIPPTPGPVAVAALIGADLGWVILFGIVCGFPAMVVAGIMFGRLAGDRLHVPVPEFVVDSAPDERGRVPSFGLTVGLILVPLLLILTSTVSSVLLPEDDALRGVLQFIGHPFTALIIAALLAYYFFGIRCGYSRMELQDFAGRALEPIGMIILVTGAGGVFGRVLITTGMGETLTELMAASNIPIILFAFIVAVIIRVSQGSATVSMVTAAGLTAPLVAAGAYSGPMLGLITVAIASGATVLSHVNDSGFWLVGRFLGLSEANTLRTWTIMETLVGVVGVVTALLISLFIP